MGATGIVEFILLAAAIAVPVSIAAGGAVYIMRLMRKGPEATLAQAARRRELA